MSNIGITLILAELLLSAVYICQTSKKLSFHHPKRKI